MSDHQCPAHRAGLNVTVTERHDRALKCMKPGCTYQPGHDGACLPDELDDLEFEEREDRKYGPR